jgi:hypothetical protein
MTVTANLKKKTMLTASKSNTLPKSLIREKYNEESSRTASVGGVGDV